MRELWRCTLSLWHSLSVPTLPTPLIESHLRSSLYFNLLTIPGSHRRSAYLWFTSEFSWAISLCTWLILFFPNPAQGLHHEWQKEMVWALGFGLFGDFYHEFYQWCVWWIYKTVYFCVCTQALEFFSSWKNFKSNALGAGNHLFPLDHSVLLCTLIFLKAEIMVKVMKSHASGHMLMPTNLFHILWG